jgi:hypothetical protein
VLMRRVVEISTTRIAFLLACATAGALTVCALATAGAFRIAIPIAGSTVQAEQGNAFMVRVSPGPIVRLSDDQFASFQGASELTEDAHLLGPGRQIHQFIREHGGGLFALNSFFLRFSTSDRSDPRKNGRSYQLRTPFLPSPVLLLAVLPGIALIVFQVTAHTTGHRAPVLRSKADWVWALGAFTGGAVLVVLLIPGAGFVTLSISPAVMHLAILGGVALAVAPFVSRQTTTVIAGQGKATESRVPKC